MNVGDHLTLVVLRGQELPGELVERNRLGAGDLDRAVHRRADRELGQRGGDVVGGDGLQRAGDRRTRLPSVPDLAMPPTNSKNWVERRIV